MGSSDWQQQGEKQLDYLRQNGLLPHHTLLDIGCGTLRAGRHFIRYLEPARYTGFDLSPAAVAYARGLVSKEGLNAKSPRLFVNAEKNLRFERLAGQVFDYILAFSVFSHLPAEQIEECLANIRTIMHDRSRFFFTFKETETFTRKTEKDFGYPFKFIAEWAARYRFTLTRRNDYPYLRTQVMIEAR
ncbi:MAG: class I SAM-dependent methyltransferase [Xanthobacteraceae bacterium]